MLVEVKEQWFVSSGVSRAMKVVLIWHSVWRLFFLWAQRVAWRSGASTWSSVCFALWMMSFRDRGRVSEHVPQQMAPQSGSLTRNAHTHCPRQQRFLCPARVWTSRFRPLPVSLQKKSSCKSRLRFVHFLFRNSVITMSLCLPYSRHVVPHPSSWATTCPELPVCPHCWLLCSQTFSFSDLSVAAGALLVYSRASFFSLSRACPEPVLKAGTWTIWPSHVSSPSPPRRQDPTAAWCSCARIGNILSSGATCSRKWGLALPTNWTLSGAFNQSVETFLLRSACLSEW